LRTRIFYFDNEYKIEQYKLTEDILNDMQEQVERIIGKPYNDWNEKEKIK
jgi:hypothetical protein